MTHPSVVRIGKISYINASPVYYGLDQGPLPSWLELVPDVPSALNRQIMAGDVVLSPISSAFYAMNYKDLLLLPGLSISCNGPVLSVILASHCPMAELTAQKVIFSRESASAASFMKMIFLRKNIEPDYEIGPIKDCRQLARASAGVLAIGDVALTEPWSQSFEYVYDLGQIWYEMTQLPFVFAVWAVRKDFARAFPQRVCDIHQRLLDSMAAGYAQIRSVVAAGQKATGLDADLVQDYFNHLFCDLDPLKIKAMQLFFDSLFEQGILEEKTEISFFNPA